MSDTRPSMSDLTPAVGGSIGGATVILFVTSQDLSQWVRLSGVIAAGIALCVGAYCERGIREARNGTEQARIEAANQPNVLVTNDPSDLMED